VKAPCGRRPCGRERMRSSHDALEHRERVSHSEDSPGYS
jgi:hypothetical protein